MSRSTAQTLAAGFGVGFLALGVIGFVPGVTSGAGEIAFAGRETGAELLGLFPVTALHNLLHLAFGIGVVMAASPLLALAYLASSAVLYALLFAAGVVFGDDIASVLGSNGWNDASHLAFAAAFAAAALVAQRS